MKTLNKLKLVLKATALVLTLTGCQGFHISPNMGGQYQYSQPTVITTQVPIYNPQTKMVQYYQQTQTIGQQQSFSSGMAQGLQNALR